MSIKHLVLGGALLMGAASAGRSQADWHGVYIGATGGYTFGSAAITTSTVVDPSGYLDQSSVDEINAAGAHTFAPSGPIVGATLGWNLSHGKTLFGLEGDLNSGSSAQSFYVTESLLCCSGGIYTLEQATKTDWMATLRLRLGLQRPTSLWYVTAGAAIASVQMDESYFDNIGEGSQTSLHRSTRTGWTAGAGLEHLLCENGKWTFKIEYLYADLGTMTFAGGNLTVGMNPQPLNPFTNTLKLTSSVARVGLNFHFGK